jgi:hypothetical protein
MQQTDLSVSGEGLSVAALPAGSPGTTNALVGTVTLLSHTTSMATSSSETTSFTVLVDRIHNPVNGRIVADGIVVRINKNNFIILEGSILVHPVAVEHTEVGANATNTALSNSTEVTTVLQLVNTLVLGLTINNTLRIRSFTSTTANSNTVHNITLLGLHSKSASLIGTSGVRDTADLRKLTVLPGADTEEVTHSIALLLSPKFFKILVSTHSLLFRK